MQDQQVDSKVRICDDELMRQIGDWAQTDVRTTLPFSGEFGPGVAQWSATVEVPTLGDYDCPDGRLVAVKDYPWGATLPVMHADGYRLDLYDLDIDVFSVLDGLGADEAGCTSLLTDRESLQILDEAMHLVVINRLERNKDLAGIPHVALACAQQVLYSVCIDPRAVYACTPYPFAAAEDVRERVLRSGVLPGWLTGFWSGLGFWQVGDTHAWMRDEDHAQPSAVVQALAALNIPTR